MNIRYLVLLLVGTILWLSARPAAAAGEKTPPTSPATSAPPSSKQMRQAVERSLVFLQKSADDWYEHGQLHSVELKDGRKIVGGTVQKKCVSCHHLPMTIWALAEAKEHGFTVDDKSLHRLQDQAIAPHLRTPDLKPVVGNQDSRGDSKTVMNTIYLSISSAATAKPDEQALDAMKKFAAHLIDMQEADGRWRASKTEYQPPVIDIDEVLTMQALLVLATAHERGHVDAGKWATSCARALEWLRKTKLRDQHQSLALNVLVSQRFGKPEEAQPLLKKLLQTQNADGGWSQVKELPSDALATGQTLYVLANLGSGSADQQRAIQRAQAFLMDTQLKDGSWWVPTRNALSKGRKGQASSHYGSGWATVGLIRMLGLPAAALPAEQPAPPNGAVTIATKFPGGNVKEQRNESGCVQLAPDLRGDNPWFYWYFEANAAQPGRVRFVFPEKVVGFKNGAVGFQGPAISTDRGKSWKWMGTDSVKDNAFTYDFAKKGEAVRFAVTIPYVSSNLEEFLAKHAKNAHLKTSTLTKSRGEREVKLLRIGTPGPERQAILFTARHHAAETIASYVLEGMLEEAMADSPDGKAFRERYVLYAVPFVDQDGVENGDQGKNRKPHDHNRDYGEKSIYPEVIAIKKLHADTGFRYALDLHCPTLVMEDHQVMYFVGLKSHPVNNFSNVSAFAARIKNGLPKTAPYGPLVWLKDEASPAAMNSWYFGTRAGVIMAATLEVPFAPPGKATDPASCRRYGRVILQAFVATRFVSASDAKGK